MFGLGLICGVILTAVVVCAAVWLLAANDLRIWEDGK